MLLVQQLAVHDALAILLFNLGAAEESKLNQRSKETLFCTIELLENLISTAIVRKPKLLIIDPPSAVVFEVP